MAVHKLFPSKDSTIYSFYPTMNTGIDPILESSNQIPTTSPDPQVSRFLIQFDQTEIEDVIDNKIGSLNFTSSLKTYIAQAQNITSENTLFAYPLAQSWNNGSGQFLDSPITTNGSSWKYRTFDGGDGWTTNFGIGTYTTGSYLSNNIGGGAWFTGSVSYQTHPTVGFSQSFDLRTTKDLTLEVSDIIKIWYSSSNTLGGYPSIDNNGFIVKWGDTIEFNASPSVQPITRFYSVDTNTIYPPVLELKWDDSSYSTTLPPVTSEDIFISLDSNQGEFYKESVNRFRLNVRPEFPVRTFQTASLFTTNHSLPQESYYAIKDLDTNEFVVDFDNSCTKISCDNTSNYFDVYMNGLQPERYYQILIKTTISGSTIIKDDNYYFKVING